MKVAIVSENIDVLSQLAGICSMSSGGCEITEIHQHPSLINLTSPDIAATNMLIIDVVDESSVDWGRVESFNTLYPNTFVVIVTSTISEAMMMAAMRFGVRDIINIASANSSLCDIVVRARKKLESLSIMNAHGNNSGAKILCFIPSKGGSGSSFISSNLAYILAHSFQKRVLCIDLDLEFSDASFCLTEDDSKRSIADLVGKGSMNTAFVESACIQMDRNFWLLRAPQNPEQAVGITPEHIEEIIGVASRHFDFICIDIARTLDPIALQAMDCADTIYPIMQASLPYVRGMQRLQRTFRALRYPESKIQMVANREGNFDDIPLPEIEKSVGARFVVKLPNDFGNVNASINAGKPLVLIAPKGVLTHALSTWCAKMCGVNEAHASGTATGSNSFMRKITSLFE